MGKIGRMLSFQRKKKRASAAAAASVNSRSAIRLAARVQWKRKASTSIAPTISNKRPSRSQHNSGGAGQGTIVPAGTAQAGTAQPSMGNGVASGLVMQPSMGDGVASGLVMLGQGITQSVQGLTQSLAQSIQEQLLQHKLQQDEALRCLQDSNEQQTQRRRGGRHCSPAGVARLGAPREMHLPRPPLEAPPPPRRLEPL